MKIHEQKNEIAYLDGDFITFSLVNRNHFANTHKPNKINNNIQSEKNKLHL